MNVPVSTNNIGSHPAARKTAPAKSREMRGPCSVVMRALRQCVQRSKSDGSTTAMQPIERSCPICTMLRLDFKWFYCKRYR